MATAVSTPRKSLLFEFISWSSCLALRLRERCDCTPLQPSWSDSVTDEQHYLQMPLKNAFIAKEKWSAMFVGVSFPTLGCWEITRRYDDDELTFVIWVTK